MRLTIKLKLILAFGLVITLAVLSTAIAIGGLSGLNDRMTYNHGAAKRMQTAIEMQELATELSSREKSAILETTDEGTASALSELAKTRQQFIPLFDSVYGAASEEGRHALDAVKTVWEPYVAAQDKLAAYAALNSNDRAQALYGNQIVPAGDEMFALLHRLEDRLEAGNAPRAALTMVHVDAALESYEGDLLHLLAASSMADLEKREKAVAADAMDIRHRLDTVKTQIAAPEDRSAFDQFSDRFERWNKLIEQASAVARDGGSIQASALSQGPLQTLRKQLNSALDGYLAQARRKVEAAVVSGEEEYRDARVMLILTSLISAIVSIAAATWMAVSLNRGMGKAVTLANAVATGDLTYSVEASSNDEIKDLIDSLNSMSSKLRMVVSDTISAAQNVSSGSQELSAGAEQMSQGSNEQAASTEEASASVEEMASNIKQNAENASQTEKIARQSAKDAQLSGEAVSKAVEAMQTIAEKISIVQEIARQTDLLALNAAVEAARAGEHGKGFAVVASEVRKLAERSQAAAAEISILSSDTVKQAQKAGEMLGKLVPDIKRTAELVEEITAACREQDIGTEQINIAIQQLDTVTQQNAAASEEISATAEVLATQAEQMQETISYFRIEEHQGRAARKTGQTDHRTAEIAKPEPRLARAAVKPPVARAPARPIKPVAASGRANGKSTRKNGVALDMATTGTDSEDAEFQSF